MTQINFTNSLPLDQKNAGRATIVLVGPINLTFANALVDSGAEFVLLPRDPFNRANLNFANGKSIIVNGITGSTQMTLMQSVNLEIEGTSVVTDVLFSNVPCPPILGRSGLRALTSAYGFDNTTWLW